MSEGGDWAAREAGHHFNDPGRRRAESGMRFVVKPINIEKPLCALEHERVKEWHLCRHMMTSVSGFHKFCWRQMNLSGGSWAQWGWSRVRHLLPVFPFVREQWETLLFLCAFQWRNSSWRKQHLKKQVLLAVEVIALISTETRSFQGNRLPIGLRHHTSEMWKAACNQSPEDSFHLDEEVISPSDRGKLKKTWLHESSVTFVLGRMWQFWQVLFNPASEIRWRLTVTDGRD